MNKNSISTKKIQSLRKETKKVVEAIKKMGGQGAKKDEGFKVVITGKGGAGKTTITAFLARLFAKKGYKVLAVDEDPQMNLPFAIGISPDEAASITPLSRNLDYIEEKTGAKPGSGWGLLLRLNPDVEDVVDRFGVTGPDNVNLLVMGTVVQAATGCLCPENALLEAVMNYIVLREKEIVLMDTQAGMEHFGRAIARGFSQALIVTDPSFNSVQVSLNLAKLAKQLNIKNIHLVINKVRNRKEEIKVNKYLKTMSNIRFDTVTVIPFDPVLLEVEPSVEPFITEKEYSLVTWKMIDLMETLEKYAFKKGR